jgi:hypothetical protein
VFPLASTIKVVASSSTDKFSPKRNSLAFIINSSMPLPLTKVDGFSYPYPVFFNIINAMFFRFGNEKKIRAERCCFINVFPMAPDLNSFVSHLFPTIVKQYKRNGSWATELDKTRRKLSMNIMLAEDELILDLPRFFHADLPMCFVAPFSEALPLQKGTLTRAWFRSILSFLAELGENRLATYTKEDKLLTNKKVRNALLWSELSYPEDSKRFIDAVTIGRKILATSQKIKIVLDKELFTQVEGFLRLEYMDEYVAGAMFGGALYSTIETLLLNGRPLLRKYPRDTSYQKASFITCENAKHIIKKISSL